jgi:endonuclease/exonuclease/phosphatase family metal-dependent hydrolase
MLLPSYIAPFVLFAHAALAVTLPLRIVSFNIRYDTSSLEDNEKSWWTLLCPIWNTMCREYESRAALSAIATGAPTGAAVLFGLQEVLDNQLSDIKSGLGPAWAHIGVARDDGAQSGEYSPILYDTSTLRVVYSETKWLSPTPDTVSYGWGAGSRRIVTVGVFEHLASGKRFVHANTHLDNVSAQARTEGIQVVVARIQAVQATYGPLGVTLTGDFNSAAGGDAYETLVGLDYVEDLWNLAPHIGTNQLTYTGFTTTGISRIDFVWVGPIGGGYYSDDKIEIVTNVRDDVIFSDHRPVVGDLTLL